MESTEMPVVAGSDNRASGLLRTVDPAWQGDAVRVLGRRNRSGRSIGRRESKFGSVPAVWNLDLDEMGSAFCQIVFSEAFPQPVRLDPNDRVPALIEVRASAKCLNGDIVLLYIVRGTFQKLGRYIDEQLLQPGSSVENPRPENRLNFHPLFS